MEEDIITIASIKDVKEVRIDVWENLEPQHECCIYRVPNDLRKINEEAYTPKVISIGPLHHGKYELDNMEKQKIRYQREFSRRITSETWQDLINFIEKSEQRIRNCYEETAQLNKCEFITMILYDAVFIIELFLRYQEAMRDFLFDKPLLRAVIFSDLQLLENQLPFFVLKELYAIAKAEDYPSFFSLSCAFFNFYCPPFHEEQLSKIDVEEEIKHFTDLRRYVMAKSYRPVSREFDRDLRSRLLVTDLPCAVKLQESGVKFKSYEGESLDVRFEKIKKLWFVEHVLLIPRMEVYDETELLIRNVMALEQCHYPCKTHVCNFMDLMDFLVNDGKDVDLLADAGIISSNTGDSTRVAKMFNRLCLRIHFSPSHYCDIVEALKIHYGKPWNHTKEALKRVYC